MLNKVKGKFKFLRGASFIWIYFLIIISIIPLLNIFPSDLFDYGKSICPSLILLNKKCIGCGLTRATWHLFHFEFKTALKYNSYVWLFLLPLFLLYFIEITAVLYALWRNENYFPFWFMRNLILIKKLNLSIISFVVSIISIVLGILFIIWFIIIKHIVEI